MNWRSLAVVFILACSEQVLSLTEEEIFQQFQFNFATPGARANAMGRAFIGLADDATAAETNPAGLIILGKPEVSFEYKNTDFSIQRFRSLEDSGQNINSPAFLSFVYPSERWRFAFFRQEFLNYKESFILQRVSIPGASTFFPATSVSGEFLGANYGGAIAYQFSTKLLLGASAKLSELKVHTARKTPFTSVVDSTSYGLSFTLGALINPMGFFTVGVTYEKNARFQYTLSQSVSPHTVDFSIRVPDRFGFGLAVRPVSHITLVSDLVYIQYSQLADDFTVVNFDLDPIDFAIDNEIELHIGAEGTFKAGNQYLAIRGGLFTNPDHALQYIGPVTPGFRTAVNVFFNSRNRDTQIGYTVGGGIALNRNIQVDAAYIISDPFDEFSISAVYKF